MKEQRDSWADSLNRLPPALASLHAQRPADVLSLPEGGAVTLEQIGQVLRAQAADQPSAGLPRPLRDDRAAAGMMAAAWRHITFRQARAVLALFDVGLQPETQANARVCLEHAVLLQRLALAADADATGPLLEELAANQHRRQQQRLDYLDELDAAAGGKNRTLIAEARQLRGAGAPARNRTRPQAGTVASHFHGIPNGPHFHSIYGQLSENTHAGFSSAAPFLYRSLKTGEPVSPEPDCVPWAETLMLVSWSCWAADDAMRRFLSDDHDPAARHVALLASLGLVAG
jgi:hypothetical protein